MGDVSPTHSLSIMAQHTQQEINPHKLQTILLINLSIKK